MPHTQCCLHAILWLQLRSNSAARDTHIVWQLQLSHVPRHSFKAATYRRLVQSAHIASADHDALHNLLLSSYLLCSPSKALYTSLLDTAGKVCSFQDHCTTSSVTCLRVSTCGHLPTPCHLYMYVHRYTVYVDQCRLLYTTNKAVDTARHCTTKSVTSLSVSTRCHLPTLCSLQVDQRRLMYTKGCTDAAGKTAHHCTTKSVTGLSVSTCMLALSKL
jgi:hypothetical protein